MKSVLMSIRPEWCEKIVSGRKTMELRKSIPKLELPFKCYIYCTLAGSNELFRKTLRGDIARWNKEKWADKKGRVIGEFICDAILSRCEMANADLAERMALVRREDILKYSNGKEVFGWHITELKIYDKPLELRDFKVQQSNEIWSFTKRLEKAPQSWCYVEDAR